MNIRFLADEDVDADILEGLRSREPAIDILDVKTAGLRGTTDPALLELAAAQGRILIIYDRRTMTRHFRKRVDAGKHVPGVFILPQRQSAIGEIIESLLLVWNGISSGGVAESDRVSALQMTRMLQHAGPAWYNWTKER